MEQQLDRLNLLAIELLEYLGNTEPCEAQIKSVERLLANSYVCKKLAFDERLSRREVMCLQLAAFGESADTTAAILKISPSTVATHRKRLREKLMAKTMAQAIYTGVRYGWVNPEMTCVADVVCMD